MCSVLRICERSAASLRILKYVSRSIFLLRRLRERRGRDHGHEHESDTEHRRRMDPPKQATVAGGQVGQVGGLGQAASARLPEPRQGGRCGSQIAMIEERCRLHSPPSSNPAFPSIRCPVRRRQMTTRGRRPPRPRNGADLLGPAHARQQARCDRHRPDHAGGRLRVGEPRHPRRALEGGFVPLSDARFPRPRARAARRSSSPAIALPSDRRARCRRPASRPSPKKSASRW